MFLMSEVPLYPLTKQKTLHTLTPEPNTLPGAAPRSVSAKGSGFRVGVFLWTRYPCR